MLREYLMCRIYKYISAYMVDDLNMKTDVYINTFLLHNVTLNKCTKLSTSKIY